jgi:biotin carboxylase
MKKAYRMFNHHGMFYIQNNATGKQTSLGTKNKEQAQKLFQVHNQIDQSAIINLEIGKLYIRAADPKMANRTWRVAMDELSLHGIEATQNRCKRAMQSKAFVLLIPTRNVEEPIIIPRNPATLKNNHP